MKKIRRWKTRAALVAGLALLVTLPCALGALGAGEGRVYDLTLRLMKPPVSPSVHLVCLDEETHAALGNRNPNRAEIARAVENLWEAGPTLIALDLLLGEARDEEGDAALEKAMSRADTVLACSPSASLMPLPRFRAQAVGLGSIDLITDGDGIVRSLPKPYFSISDGRLVVDSLPMAMECARLSWFPKGSPPFEMRGDDLWLGPHALRMDRTAWWIPYCGGDGTLPRTPLIAAIRGDGDALAGLKNAVVLVGSTRASQHDYFSVPLPAARRPSADGESLASHTMAGVEIHGQALSALLEGVWVKPVGSGVRWLLFALVAAWGTTAILVPMRPAASLALWAASGIALLGGGLAAARAGQPIPLLGLTVPWAAYGATAFIHQRYVDFFERRAVERLFSRYVSPNIAAKLLRHPELVQLGGRRRELTVLFSDIRGFTSLSERLAPEEVSGLLNEYFTEMTDVLFAHDGTLDKFIGDAILAFFGDPLDQPDHTERALLCAAAMQERAAALRRRFEAENKPPLHMGVAVNRGPVVVGNNGSESNFAYTVIGDTVNLASRLQGLATRDDVILTEATAAAVPGFKQRFLWEEMEPVLVKGKKDPVRVVRVVGKATSQTEGGHP